MVKMKLRIMPPKKLTKFKRLTKKTLILLKTPMERKLPQRRRLMTKPVRFGQICQTIYKLTSKINLPQKPVQKVQYLNNDT